MDQRRSEAPTSEGPRRFTARGAFDLTTGDHAPTKWVATPDPCQRPTAPVPIADAARVMTAGPGALNRVDIDIPTVGNVKLISLGIEWRT